MVSRGSRFADDEVPANELRPLETDATQDTGASDF